MSARSWARLLPIRMAAILIGLVLLGRFLLDSLVGYTHRLFLMISNI